MMTKEVYSHSLNSLETMGVNILTERSNKISGNPYRKKLKKQVHDEPMHIQEHAKLAESCGIDQFEIRNGDVIENRICVNNYGLKLRVVVITRIKFIYRFK